MNLVSIPKPAVGFIYDGSLTAVMQLQAFLQTNGYELNSMTLNADAQSQMKYNINMSYFKVPPEGGSVQYLNGSIINGNIVVIQQESTPILALNQEQFDASFTIVE